jgi:dTDP-glucose 4,6-dehydratase
LITRTCNNYGENQNKEKFLPTVINSIKNDLEIPVYGDGSQVREWIHVIDNVNAIYNLMMSNDVNETYNIGSGERYSNLGVIKIIGEILSKDIKYKFVEDRLGHDKRYSIHSMKYENNFGKIPTIKLKEWLKQILEKF